MSVPTAPRGRVVIRLVLAVAVALGSLLLGALPANAHASLVSTDPAEGAVLQTAPERVTLTFDEAVTLAEDGVQLYDATGRELPAEARSVDEVVEVTTPAAEMTEGTFVVTYRVVSGDSHPIAGALTFSVGSPSDTVVTPDLGAVTEPATTVLLGVLHGLTYLGLFLAAGLAVFCALLLPGADLTELRTRLRRLGRAAAAVAVAGAVLLVPAGVLYREGLGLGGLAQGIAWTGWSSGDGLLALLVTAGLALAVLAWRADTPTAGSRAAVLAGSAVALGALALVGHTRSYGPAVLVLAADVFHVLAAAMWFGGLVGLVLSLRALAGQERLAAETLARFSMAAGGLLAVVAVAGSVLGWRILGSWSALVGTAYGWLLLMKVALVALVVAVAAWNRYSLLPQVLAAEGPEERRGVAERMRLAVRDEAGLLVLVLALTGVLVNQVPQQTAAPEPVAQETTVVTAQDVQLVAHVHPGRVGRNTITVQVQDLSGEPLEPFAAPTVSVSNGAVDLGSQDTRNIGSGTYAAELVIPQPGTWTVQVSVRTGEFENPVLSFQTEVGPAG